MGKWLPGFFPPVFFFLFFSSSCIELTRCSPSPLITCELSRLTFPQNGSLPPTRSANVNLFLCNSFEQMLCIINSPGRIISMINEANYFEVFIFSVNQVWYIVLRYTTFVLSFGVFWILVLINLCTPEPLIFYKFCPYQTDPCVLFCLMSFTPLCLLIILIIFVTRVIRVIYTVKKGSL